MTAFITCPGKLETDEACRSAAPGVHLPVGAASENAYLSSSAVSLPKKSTSTEVSRPAEKERPAPDTIRARAVATERGRSGRLAPPTACSRQHLHDRLELEGGTGDERGGDDGVLPHGRFLSDLADRADQGHVLDERGGHGGDRVGLVAAEVEVLNLGAFALVAHAGEHLVVEVRPPGPHAADVEGEHRTQEVGAPLDVVGDDHRQQRHDLEGLEPLVPAPVAAEALGQCSAVEGVTLR